MLEHVHCNICGGSSYKVINTCQITVEDADTEERVLNLVRCNSCGLLFVNPRPVFSAEQVKRLYSKYYFERGYMRFYSGEEGKNGFQSNESFAFRLSLIERYKTGGRLLDIGCATGGFLKVAQDKGWQAWGVELSDYASELAKKEYNLNVFKGHLAEAQFKDGYFDVICAGDILEHVDNPSGLLKEANRIMGRDGILYLAMPNADSFYYRFFGMLARCNRRNYFLLPHHIYHFSPSTIKLLLGKSGFKIIELVFSSSRSPSFFMNIFNFRDRVIVIARNNEKSG